MNNHATPQHRGRRSAALLLAGGLLILGAGILLTVLSGGYLAYVFAALALIALVGVAHYFLWGRAMDGDEALPQGNRPYGAGGDFEGTRPDYPDPRA